MEDHLDSFCTLTDFGTFEVSTADGHQYVIATKPCLGRVVQVTGGPQGWQDMDIEVRRDTIALGESVEFIYPVPDETTATITSIRRLS